MTYIKRTKVPHPLKNISKEYPYIGSTDDIVDEELQMSLKQIIATLLGSSGNPLGVDSEVSLESTNPVQNKVITAYILELLGNYQQSLVNQSNIKSINNKSILGSGNIQLFEVLTQEQYNALETKARDTLYLIVEETDDEPTGSWRFGDGFPIILGEGNWGFGGSFPIILT